MAKRRKPTASATPAPRGPVYAFTDAVRTYPNAKTADPQVIGLSLAQIARANNGRLLPTDVWREAQASETHPLHQHFEWDLRTAAEAHWTDTARAICRSVTVVYDETSGEPPKRMWLSVDDAATGISYREVAEVLGSRELALAVMRRAERDLAAWEARYQSLKDICEIISTARRMLSDRLAGDEARPS